jgi:hypothetical protein
MLTQLIAILALGALCAVWVMLQRASGCEYSESCGACNCRKSREATVADGASAGVSDDVDDAGPPPP